MRISTCITLLAAMLYVGAAAASPVMLRPGADSGGTPVSVNGGFERAAGSKLSGWRPIGRGYTVSLTEGIGGTKCASVSSLKHEFGLLQRISVDQAARKPVLVSLYSRSLGVSGRPDSGYSISVEVTYDDATSSTRWFPFRVGTHGWERGGFVLVPDKPISSIAVYCLFRNHRGRVWFDNCSVEELPAAAVSVNGSFSSLTGWYAYGSGYTSAPAEGISGTAAVTCSSADPAQGYGIAQQVQLNRSEIRPIVIRGWSRASNVSGSSGMDYSLYADIIYDDGTARWGVTSNFSTGTHDWQKGEIYFVPEKPVRTVTVYALFRYHAGQVWFDDVTVEEAAFTPELVTFQGGSYYLRPGPADTTRTTVSTQDGLSLSLGQSQVTSLVIDGTQLASAAPSGFMVRDNTTGSDVYCLDPVAQGTDQLNGICTDLNLHVASTVSAASDHIRFDGRVTSTIGEDRAVTLAFALPIDVSGWNWGYDCRRSAVVQPSGSVPAQEYCNTVDIGSGSTGTISLYPTSALFTTGGPNRGLAMAVDMGKPVQYRLACNPDTGQMVVVFDLALVSDTVNFVNAADFSFIIYKIVPSWGFRTAWDKYTRIFPDYFTVRSIDQGNWIVTTDVETIQGWQDFGFKYHEGVQNGSFLNANNIKCLGYHEPTTWWMDLMSSVTPTLADALAARADYAGADPPVVYHTLLAQASQNCSMKNADGDPYVSFFQLSADRWWVLWSIDASPYAPGNPNFRDTYFTPGYFWLNYDRPDLPYRADGEYLDSLDAFYEYGNLDYARTNFANSTAPLTFDTDTKRPVLLRAFENCEYVKWLAGEMRDRDKLMMANYVPKKFTAFCSWLDVMGTETYWWQNGSYVPESDENMLMWRTIAGRRPYCLVQNVDYNAFTDYYVNKYFMRSAFYGIWPSFFSPTGYGSFYFENPAWYNRDRYLFVKYVPIIEQVAESGWQPVTAAWSDNPNVYVERFGQGAAGTGAVYVNLLNTGSQSQNATVTLDTAALGLGDSISAHELIHSYYPTVQDGRFTATIAAGETWVVKLISP